MIKEQLLRKIDTFLENLGAKYVIKSTKVNHCSILSHYSTITKLLYVAIKFK